MLTILQGRWKCVPIFSWIFILPLVVGCKSGQVTKQQLEATPLTEVENTAPKILLVNIEIGPGDQIKILGHSSNPGRLRSVPMSGLPQRDGDLKILLLSDFGLPCDSVWVENPLQKKMEYAESDDISSLHAKTVELESASFSVRLQQDDCFKNIQVLRKQGESMIDLGTFELKYKRK